MKRAFSAEYWEHDSKRPFDEVTAAFEASLGVIQPAEMQRYVSKCPDYAAFADSIRQHEGSSGFMRFYTVNHGAWMTRFEGVDRRFNRLCPW